MKITIGANIKRLRTAKNVTQEQLAKAVGMGRGTLSTKMNGHRSFNTEEIVAIC